MVALCKFGCTQMDDCGGECKAPAVSASPSNDLLSAALDIYKPPFKYSCTYIFDAKDNMVMNSDELEESALVLRGWGRIGYMDDAEALHDAVGEHIARALTEYWEKNLGR